MKRWITDTDDSVIVCITGKASVLSSSLSLTSESRENSRGASDAESQDPPDEQDVVFINVENGTASPTRADGIGEYFEPAEQHAQRISSLLSRATTLAQEASMIERGGEASSKYVERVDLYLYLSG